MEAPWSLRTENKRESDGLPTFIIFCEDEVSEVLYFRFFETNRIKVNVVGGLKSKTDHVQLAMQDCIDKGLMINKDNKPKIVDGSPFIWCVFDRDASTEDKKDKKTGNLSFSQSITLAEESGIKVAWSNDSFELWILLHFEDVPVNNGDFKSRKAYYERLSEIFKNLKNPNDFLSRMIAHKAFNYKVFLKSGKAFQFIVRPELEGKIPDAVRRAKALEDHHKGTALLHDKAPCTMVHHLVIQLVDNGKKIAL